MTANRQAGFTLLEVLVAMAILGLAVTTMMQLSSQGLRLLKLSGEHQRAVLLADRVAREARPDGEGVQSGEDGAYRWERRIAAVAVPRELTPPAGAPPQLFSVAVAVRWGDRRAVELATLRAAVIQSPGAAPR